MVGWVFFDGQEFSIIDIMRRVPPPMPLLRRTFPRLKMASRIVQLNEELVGYKQLKVSICSSLPPPSSNKFQY